MNGKETEVVLDTGADVTLVPDNLVPDIELGSEVVSIQGIGRAKREARKAIVNFEIMVFVFSQEVAIVPPEYHPSVLLSIDAERIPLLRACLDNIEAETSKNLT